MMYSDKLVVALKHNGKILREAKDTVFVPFGSEYSILVKNLNIVKCLVRISIDGKDVGDNGRFVINPGQELDLERSISNGNMNEGNKFKFIERTSSVEEHRGVKLEDGLIKVEFEFERVFAQPQWPGTPQWTNPSLSVCGHITKGGMVGSTMDCSSTTDYSGVSRGINHSANYTSTATVAQANLNDVGITVAGSRSEQKFQTALSFLTDGDKHVIVLKILGQVGDIIVKEPVTVKTKKICSTCGSSEKYSASFCSKCGTSLDII